MSEELGPALTVVDISRGTVGIFTAIRTLDTAGFLAIRLSTEAGRITACEHIFSTPRNLSGPPTPIGDVAEFQHNPVITQLLDPAQRASEDVLISLANGYWSTLRTTQATYVGPTSPTIAFGSRTARPTRARSSSFSSVDTASTNASDRAFLLIDEERGLVMSRAFIDHKGVLDTYRLKDGTVVESIFREPHSWHTLELFKIASGEIIAIEATFIAVPYFMPTVWP